MSKPQTIEQVFESYLKSMAVSRRPGTIRQYRSTLRHFLRYLSGHYPKFADSPNCVVIRISSGGLLACAASVIARVSIKCWICVSASATLLPKENTV
jgi:hypothetical protein